MDNHLEENKPAVAQSRAEGASSNVGLCVNLAMECVGSMAFGKYEGVRVPLIYYTGDDEYEVKRKILEAARKEGYQGTVSGRMMELGWWIEPIYALTHNV